MSSGQAECNYRTWAMLVRVFPSHLWRGKKFVNTWISKRHDKHRSPFGETAYLGVVEGEPIMWVTGAYALGIDMDRATESE